MTQDVAVKKPVVIGVVGGIASGKSEVTRAHLNSKQVQRAVRF